jgi:predicted nucleic acid-binding protein
MTRFVLDADVVLHIAAVGLEVSPEHELLAPTLMRSQTLSMLHEAVRRRELAPEVALERHERISRMKIRLLGDAVLRRVAWRLADELGWDSTYDAEYVALTKLQADALITRNTDLAKQIRGVVKVASVDALRKP